MAEEFNNEINVGPAPPLHKRRSYGWLGWLLALLIVLGVGVYGWLNYDRLAELTHSAAAATGAVSDRTVNADDYEAFQQKATTSLQAATDQLAAQQTELKRLSDAVEGLTGQVAALASKLDQTQGVGAPASAVPAPAATSPRPVTSTATPARPTPTAPRKRPTSPAPAGAISVGGAPLPAQPSAR
ncbi:MAG: hypothetical protein ABWY18_09055 [Tardiphaga sp.]